MAYEEDKPTPSGNTLTPAEEEDWFKQWDPLDNGKAGPIRMKIFWLCAIPGFLMPFASSIFIPVIPVINDLYSPTPVVATLTISIYSLLSGIVPMFWGPLSDKYSRKWILTGVSAIDIYFKCSKYLPKKKKGSFCLCDFKLSQCLDRFNGWNNYYENINCHTRRCIVCSINGNFNRYF